MANWTNLNTRGNVEDRRGNVLPSRYTRPILRKAVPKVGLPPPRRRAEIPGEKIDGIKNDVDKLSLSSQQLTAIKNSPKGKLPRFLGGGK